MRRQTLLSAFASVSVMALATTAFAADEPAAPADAPAPAKSVQPGAAGGNDTAYTLPEVVVTARKREENLQRVPIAITAFNGAQLKQDNVLTITDIQGQVPSLSTETSNVERDQPMWGIRGQRSDSYFALQAPAVTTYFADVAQAHPAGFQRSLFDIGSVDILKGPQGTLFGKNSTGGAVVVEPNHPTDTFGGNIYGTYGNFDTVTAGAEVNIPINEAFQLRVAGQIDKNDGWMKNLAPGGKNWDMTNDGAFRVSLMFKPSTWFQSLTILDDYRNNGTPGGVRLEYVNPYSNATNPAGSYLERFNPTVDAEALALYNLEQSQTGSDRWSTSSAYGTGTSSDKFKRPELDNVYNEGITNDTTIQLSDDTKFRNILGIRRAQTVLDTDYGGGDYFIVQGVSKQGVHQFSDEMQWLGKAFDSKLDWVTGLYYLQERATEDTIAPNFLSINEVAGGGTNTAYAAFAQGTYHFTDHLRATLGVRFNRDNALGIADSRSLVSTTSLLWGKTTPKACSEGTYTGSTFKAFPLSSCFLKDSATFTVPTWTASLEYDLPDMGLPLDNGLVYFTDRRGYRAGGFNIHATYAGTFGPYKPELALDNEIGFKGDWRLGGDQKLRTNLALYYDHFDDLQRTVNVLVPNNPIPLSTIRNAASSRVYGAELEYTYIPIPTVEIYGFYNYTNAKYIKYESVTQSGMPLDESGNPFVDTPQNKFAINGRWEHEFGDNVGVFSVTANYTWQDSIKLAEQPMANGVIPTQAAYGLWNFRADLTNIGGKNLDAGIWVKNAFDKYYNVGFADISESLGIAVVLPGEPRMFGVDLKYHF
jgi:iron complex outermembrane receptor protein